jgi:2-methylisocitrate lyase-like PEP mutase family enzyme
MRSLVSLRSLLQRPLPITAPLVLNPLMATMVEAAGFPAGYLGGGPLMYLTGRNGLAGLGMTLADLGGLGYKIVADPSTPLLAAFVAWQRVYEHLADGFGAQTKAAPDWGPAEKAMLSAIDLEKLLSVERATVEKDQT